MPAEATNDSMLADILGHPWVARAQVTAGGVTVWPDPATTAAGSQPGPLLQEHLDHWAEVYDWVYEDAAGRHSDDLDLSGWRASDTGLPLPTEHMRDWLARTVELVLAQRPRRVLEIGCGTGLLAHRLHSQVDGYVGTDVADAAVRRLAHAGLPRAAFVRAGAHQSTTPWVRAVTDDVFGVDVRPDCVLLNSVTQCFPGLEYLATVLRQALATVADGGTVVVGDIRHAGLLTAHFTWLERTRDPGLSGADLDPAVRAAVAADEEFSFSPQAVAPLLVGGERPVGVSLHARTMALDTELTRYRYDLVLHVGPDRNSAPVPRVTRWSRPPDTDVAGALRTALADQPLLVSGIPNALLCDLPDAITPYALRQAVRGLDAAVLIDPYDPRLIAVVAPAACGVLPLDALLPAGSTVQAPAHEPLPGFVRRRLPEVLRDHLRARGRGPVTITVAEAAP